MTCNCPSIDGYRIPRKSCTHHKPRPVGTPPAREVFRAPDADEMACAWSEYRSNYGASGVLEHKAFKAGWQAAREGDQSGVLR